MCVWFEEVGEENGCDDRLTFNLGASLDINIDLLITGFSVFWFFFRIFLRTLCAREINPSDVLKSCFHYLVIIFLLIHYEFRGKKVDPFLSTDKNHNSSKVIISEQIS